MCKNPYIVAGGYSNGKLMLDWRKWSNQFPRNPESLGRSAFVISCGVCVDCQRAQALAWTFRQVAESQLHVDNCFVTLTYADDPYNVSLDDITKFIKRLRERVARLYGIRFRYFYCAEYGKLRMRPHYHLNIFGYCPADLKCFFTDKQGHSVYQSEEIATAWGKGFVTVGKVTPETAYYTTLYMQKSRVDIGDRVPPFRRMSRNPGLGSAFLSRINWRVTHYYLYGKRYMLPRYYYDMAIRLGISDAVAARADRLKKFVENQKIPLKTFDNQKNIDYNEFNKLKKEPQQIRLEGVQMKYRTEQDSMDDERIGLSCDPIKPVYQYNENLGDIVEVGTENTQDKIQSCVPDPLAAVFDKYLYDDCPDVDEVYDLSKPDLVDLGIIKQTCEDLRERYAVDGKISDYDMLATFAKAYGDKTSTELFEGASRAVYKTDDDGTSGDGDDNKGGH